MKAAVYTNFAEIRTGLPSTEATRHITFGTFEVDPQTGEIWRSGFRVRLAGQPFKVLLLLLERPGEVVTREELLSRVWGPNTNVDFEQGISGAVKKIREALRDSADNPRFIETLPKRGYRFIAPTAFVTKVVEASPENPPLAPEDLTPFSSATFSETSLAVPQGKVPDTAQRGIALPPADSAAPGGRGGSAAQLTVILPRKPLEWSTRESWFAGISVVLLILLVLSLLQSRRPVETQISPPYRITQVTHYVPLSVGAPNMESFLTLATDGDRILTSVLVDGRSRLAAIFTGTGGVQRIGMPDEISTGVLADISRDGSKVLVRSNSSSASEQPLWIVPSSGGSGQRVADVLAHDATWMPDGLSILYASENELRIIHQDEPSTLYAKLDGQAFWLRWSPDGKLLRFTLINPITHASSLWEMDSQDRVARPIQALSAAHLEACCGVWTIDGLTYIFQASDNLWALANFTNKARLSQLTNGPIRFQSPVAAKSGSKIYFVGLESPSGLQEFEGKHHDFEPAPSFLADANRVEYSRDGRWVAWTDIYGTLWRARAVDGSDKIRLTSEGTQVFLAHWSPDGKRLAFMARDRGGLWQIYLVSSAGGSPEALLRETRNDADPTWSPDGKELAFGREPDLMGKESGPRNLQILNIETHKIETIPGSDGLFSPRWSPDGRYIAALTLDQRALMLYNVKSQRWTQLILTSAADPVWDSESTAVFIHAFQQEGEPILRVDVKNGTTRTVASLQSFHDGEAVNYFFSGMTPSNEPLVRPRIGTGSLYSLDLSR